MIKEHLSKILLHVRLQQQWGIVSIGKLSPTGQSIIIISPFMHSAAIGVVGLANLHGQQDTNYISFLN